jgi:ribonuclease P protein component
VPDAPSSRDDARRAGSVSLRDLESLRSSGDFRRVLRRGTRHHKGFIVVVRLPGRPGPPRLGLLVAKGSGNAVTRNRIKRRLRHAVRETDLQPGTDYVIIARKEVAEVAFGQLVEWIDDSLGQAQDA